MSSPLTWIYINNLCQITCQGKKLTIRNYYSITSVPMCHSLHKDDYNTYFQWYRIKLQAPLTTTGFLLLLFPCPELRRKIHSIHCCLHLREVHGVFRELLLKIKELAQQQQNCKFCQAGSSTTDSTISLAFYTATFPCSNTPSLSYQEEARYVHHTILQLLCITTAYQKT